jgi:TetR/AcrR family transcriptional regulator, regulator of cefoperazone and chloramphenicol sensitivity
VFNLLNMRSTTSDDLTTRARIRDAAILLVAGRGWPATTMRAVAAAAGVSPGLVVHHFGSRDGLKKACDEHVLADLHAEIEAASERPAGSDVIGQLSHDPANAPRAAYAAQALSEEGEFARALVALVAADTARYLRSGAEQGLLKPSSDPDRLAELLTLYSLGARVIARHLAPPGTDPVALHTFIEKRYGQVGVEVFTHGMFADDSYLRAYQEYEKSTATTRKNATPRKKKQ